MFTGVGSKNTSALRRLRACFDRIEVLEGVAENGGGSVAAVAAVASAAAIVFETRGVCSVNAAMIVDALGTDAAMTAAATGGGACRLLTETFGHGATARIAGGSGGTLAAAA